MANRLTEQKQMTVQETLATGAAPDTGPAFSEEQLRRARVEVSRLQARIVKATQQGRCNKVKVLQRLLTHSHSARMLAVARVAGNEGRKTRVPSGRWTGRRD
jgi:RNA-directed DNA polymerase